MIYFTFVTKLLLQLSVHAKLDQQLCFTMLSVLVIKVSKNKNISTVSPVGFEKGHVCWLPPLVCFFQGCVTCLPKYVSDGQQCKTLSLFRKLMLFI